MKKFLAPLALALALGVAGSAAPTAAQDRDREECRCVDASGDAIENCTCFRAPNVRGILRSVTMMRPRLGVTVGFEQDAADDAIGARVTDVLEDGPADEAGLREGDIIVSVDGHSLLSPLSSDEEDDFDLDESIPVQRLLAISRSLDADEEVEIVYDRDGQRRTTTLETDELDFWGGNVRIRSGDGDWTVLSDRMADLGQRMQGMRMDIDSERLHDRMELLGERMEALHERGEHGMVWAGPEGGLFQSDAPRVVVGRGDGGAYSFFIGNSVGGVELMEMKPALAEYFGTDAGVLVTDVEEDSTLGLEAGDVILRIGDREATTPNRVRRILSSYADDEEITFRVMRRGNEMNVAGRIER